jgi:hypothetical protein
MVVLAVAFICSGCPANPPPAVATQASMDPPGTPRSNPAGVFVEARPRTQSPTPATSGALRTVSIEDAAGFGQPMAAMTIDIPEDWQARGGATWNRGVECFGNMLGIDWTAMSADGLQAISLLPRLTWQLSSATIMEMYPCPAAPMRSAREFLQSLVQNARPGARVLSYRDRPDLVPPMPSNAGTTRQRQWVEAGEILIGYPLQGRDMRESILVSVSFSELNDPLVGRSISASSSDALALRAPDGALDFDLLTRIQRSMRLDPAWNAQVLAYGKRVIEEISRRQAMEISNWHQRRMNEITTAGILERGRIRMDTIQAIGRINNQIVASRDASGERIHTARIDAIQEVQPWRDPTTGSQVDLSIHYQHAWQLDDGRQFLTNDPNFDPQQALGLGGHRLEPAR